MGDMENVPTFWLGMSSILAMFMITMATVFAFIKHKKPPGEHLQDATLDVCGTQHGQGCLKYHGLRERINIQDPRPQPITLAQANKVPLPRHTNDEAVKLQMLSRKLADELKLGHRADHNTLLRYLRAEKGNVVMAEKCFRDAMSVRKDYDVDAMFTDWDLDAYESCLGPWWVSGGLVGWSNEKRPVYYEPFGKCKWTQITARIPKRELVKMDLLHQMRVLGAIEEAAFEKGESMKGGIAIVDLEGFGMEQCKYHAAKMFAELIAIRDRMVPCMLHQVLVINAPASFSCAWRMVKCVLHQDTQAKFRVASSGRKTTALLKTHLDDQSIPAFLRGHPVCDEDRLKFALGGPIPQEAITRFLSMVGGHGSTGSTKSSTANSTSRRAQRSGSMWKFCLCSAGV